MCECGVNFTLQVLLGVLASVPKAVVLTTNVCLPTPSIVITVANFHQSSPPILAVLSSILTTSASSPTAYITRTFRAPDVILSTGLLW